MHSEKQTNVKANWSLNESECSRKISQNFLYVTGLKLHKFQNLHYKFMCLHDASAYPSVSDSSAEYFWNTRLKPLFITWIKTFMTLLKPKLTTPKVFQNYGQSALFPK